MTDSGEVEKIGVGVNDEGAVGIGRQDVVGVDDGDGLLGKHPSQVGPVAGKEFRVDGVVSHGSRRCSMSRSLTIAARLYHALIEVRLFVLSQ